MLLYKKLLLVTFGTTLVTMLEHAPYWTVIIQTFQPNWHEHRLPSFQFHTPQSYNVDQQNAPLLN